jgi:thiamine biosynthesis lipoprotein
MKKVIYLLIMLMVLFLPTACGQAKPYTADGFAMGALITQEIYDKDGKKTSEEVLEKIKSLEEQMTINAPGGDINKLNENAGKGYAELCAETITVLKSAQKISELSGGAFDITIGPVVKAWGIDTDKARLPADETLNKLLSLVNYQDVHIDEANRASLQKSGQIVDLGGIAKGYAGDAAIEIYKKRGIKSALINLGGNVVALGSKPDGSAWSVGVQNPSAENGEIIGVVHVSDRAVVTSGGYQKYFEKDGRRYSHIFDPHTGYPADSGLLSVTIMAPSSIEADGLSTAAFVLGAEQGMDLIKRYGRAEAVFITTDKKVFVTPGLRENFQVKAEGTEYSYVIEE